MIKLLKRLGQSWGITKAHDIQLGPTIRYVPSNTVLPQRTTQASGERNDAITYEFKRIMTELREQQEETDRKMREWR